MDCSELGEFYHIYSHNERGDAVHRRAPCDTLRFCTSYGTEKREMYVEIVCCYGITYSLLAEHMLGLGYNP
ncbi:hypothetical protein lerEdw1_013667 [Lerista edwardsae]|nr:hypothetical protein lerEdw1_013668 [Lerista edwardsae]KAJ6640511.1 hypothetical protein lerEdw1_013667 [Lerista edwardsae]